MKLHFILLLSVANFCTYAQKANIQFADTAYVYKDFVWGGTTANLWQASKVIDTMSNVTKVLLDYASLDTLNFLLGEVKSKRHYQQKVGPSYYISIIKGNQNRLIAVVPDWAIIDLENKRQFVFKNTPNAEIFNRFVERNFH